MKGITTLLSSRMGAMAIDPPLVHCAPGGSLFESSCSDLRLKSSWMPRNHHGIGPNPLISLPRPQPVIKYDPAPNNHQCSNLPPDRRMMMIIGITVPQRRGGLRRPPILPMHPIAAAILAPPQSMLLPRALKRGTMPLSCRVLAGGMRSGLQSLRTSRKGAG